MSDQNSHFIAAVENTVHEETTNEKSEHEDDDSSYDECDCLRDELDDIKEDNPPIQCEMCKKYLIINFHEVYCSTDDENTRELKRFKKFICKDCKWSDFAAWIENEYKGQNLYYNFTATYDVHNACMSFVQDLLISRLRIHSMDVCSCNEIISYDDWDNHKATACIMRKIDCPNECGKKCRAVDMKSHLKHSCVNRIIKCECCDLTMKQHQHYDMFLHEEKEHKCKHCYRKFSDLNEHITTCPKKSTKKVNVIKKPPVDEQFAKYNTMMLTEFGSFDRCFELAYLNGYIVWKDGVDQEDAMKQYKERWMSETAKWLEGAHEAGFPLSKASTSEYQVPLFCGQLYAIALLPFDQLVDNNKFSDVELRHINWFRTYYNIEQISWPRAPQRVYHETIDGTIFKHHNHNVISTELGKLAYERSKI